MVEISKYGRRRFLLTKTIPAIVLTLSIGAAMFLLLAWSSHQADHASFTRQQQLVNLVVSQLRTQIAHDQESSTVWDDAVLNAKAENAEWLDNNVGSWMHTYFGHDELYVLNPSNQPVYSFAHEEVSKPDAYSEIAPEVAPLVTKLRQKMRDGDESGLSDRILSPGVADLVVARGHPAVVSIKPIVTDTGDIEQVPGSEYFHVAVQFLDGSFTGELMNDYLFRGLRFSWSDNPSSDESSHPLKNATGKTIGYFIWKPDRPGSAVFRDAAPALAGILFLSALTILGFMSTVHARSFRLQESEAKIRHMALHDALTGLANRTKFNNCADLTLAQEPEHTTALLYLDLDHFKQVNDSLGHLVGDTLIKEFGDRLNNLVREQDIVARIGGDEFTVMLTGVSGRGEVEPLCERIVDSARKPFDIDGNRIFIGVSIGVAMAPVDGTDRIELLRKADVALYHSKSMGRGRYSFFDSGMDNDIKERLEIGQDLRNALVSGDQLMTFFQPIYSAATGELTAVEALARWKHPTRGWLPPDLFIPLAEEIGLIEELGDFVLREACTSAVKWPGLTLAINVSGVELSNPSYSLKVAQVLLSSGLDARRLELEITETSAIDGAGIAAQNLKRLRELGVQVAIDDFGTGFSSLGRLQQLKVDRIKIDKSFIHGFGRATDDEAIVQAIISLAHAKGLKTTAEGVETHSQNEHLIRFGCDDLQGFLFAEAVPAAKIDTYLGGDTTQQAPAADTSRQTEAG